MPVKRPTRRNDHARRIICAVGYARFASIRAGGAALGAKMRLIKKIERDGDKVLGGHRFFIFKQQPTKRWRA